MSLFKRREITPETPPEIKDKAVGQDVSYADYLGRREDLWLTVHARIPEARVRELMAMAEIHHISLSMLLSEILHFCVVKPPAVASSEVTLPANADAA